MSGPSPSTQRKAGPPELTAAAQALDDELSRFERLAHSLKSSALDSGKNLERVAHILKDIVEADDRLGEHVRALVAAITRARERQQAQAETIQGCAAELQRRTEMFQKLQERYAAIGKDAIDLNVRVQQISLKRQEPASAERDAALTESLSALDGRMGQVADEAQALARAAAEEDFHDVARQSDSLRQQLLSARNKMSLLRKGLLGSGA